MSDWLVPALLALNLLLLLWLALRPGQARRQERDEQAQRALRQELQDDARATRQELGATLAQFQQMLLTQGGDAARTQNEQIDTLRTQLAQLQQVVAQSLQATAERQAESLHAASTRQAEALQGVAARQAEALQAAAARQAEALQGATAQLGQQVAEQLRLLSESNERRLGEVRGAVEARLAALQQGNETKLEQMRATVDEKLHATLEQRLGESFRQVAERLDQVHKGLGEMQTLARDVGSLNRVLTNVKTRGIFGEVQLAGLLEQVFAPEQYAANVETVPGSGARVEFAVRLPGRRDDGQPIWLPIDAKFPREDHERLLEAQERADAAAAEAASRAIEMRLRLEARTIREKYLAAPYTTDFAILFLPTESLYAEALRRPGLAAALHSEHRVMLAGPTTLLATLSSLQMGFRTLALEKRSAEVWQVLGGVKTEFAKFGDVLAKTKKKLQEASSQIDAAEVRTRAMARQLRGVEALPEHGAPAALASGAGAALLGGAVAPGTPPLPWPADVDAATDVDAAEADDARAVSERGPSD